MAVKFGRNFSLILQRYDNTNGVTTTSGDPIVIDPNLTIEFDIERTEFSDNSSGTIRIYNLSQDNRALIRKDLGDHGKLFTVILQAGYGSSLNTILFGDIYQAWSVREGNNFITTLLAHDGGYAAGAAIFQEGQGTYAAGTSNNTIVNDMIDLLAQWNIQKGYVSFVDGTLSKGKSYTGSIWEALTTLTGNAFKVDTGVAYVLNNNEVIPLETFEVSAATGLLGTPIRNYSYYNFDMLFEPSLRINQRINLLSTTLTGSVGSAANPEDSSSLCKITSLHHRGTISQTVCGDAITSVGCQSGIQFLEVDTQ